MQNYSLFCIDNIITKTMKMKYSKTMFKKIISNKPCRLHNIKQLNNCL